MNNKNVQLYKTEINLIYKELDELPKGHLTKRGSFYYETAGTTQRGITKNPEKIKQLARKAYLLQRLRHLEWNLSLVKKYSERCKTESMTGVIQELSSFYKTLPINYFFHPSVHDQLNLNNVSDDKLSDPAKMIYKTNSGICVRSKSERTIAEALEQNNIPYHYERAHVFGGETRYPDFTIYRPSDGKMFLWEHFGLLDQDLYRKKMVEKVVLYARYGIFPFENLICTYEKDLRNVAYIGALIEIHFLR